MKTRRKQMLLMIPVTLSRHCESRKEEGGRERQKEREREIKRGREREREGVKEKKREDIGFLQIKFNGAHTSVKSGV